MDAHEIRSKIYTYFYGRSTIFQQFLMIAAVLCFIMSALAGEGFNIVMIVFGVLSLLVGLIWWAYKKLSFNKVGEEVVDQALQYKIQAAKTKGMEKLNIISEQIERVEPVVLHGEANPPVDVVQITKQFGSAIVQFVSRFRFMVGGLIVAAIWFGLSSLFVGFGESRNDQKTIGVVMTVITLLGLIVIGFLLCRFYELRSYVSPKVFDRLNAVSPVAMARLGSDDKVRVSLPSITVYMFGDDQLYVYYQYFDLVTGKIFCEGVHEYFYEDIVGVTSQQEVRKFLKKSKEKKGFLESVDYLRESISVVTSGCVHKETYVVDMGCSLLDTQFIGMRNLIRQKKAEK